MKCAGAGTEPKSETPLVSRGLATWGRRKIADESGNATIEFCIWFPLLVMLLGLAVEVSTTFLQMNRAWDVARDVTRRVSVGEMTLAEAEVFAETTVPARFEPDAVLAEEGVRDIRFTLTLTPHVGLFGTLSVFPLEQVTIDYVMRREVDSNTGGE